MADFNPTICIVDDDPSIRKSLSLMLNSAGYSVKTFSSAREFLESDLDIMYPGCLILDVKMPELGGFDLQEELTSRKRTTPIIFITGHGDIPMGVQAMKKGAVDFLPKPFDDDQLLKAVKFALLRDSQTRADLIEKESIMKNLESLTAREYEVLRYLISGMLNKQIAFELKISERTIKAHRKQIFNKMGTNSIAQLVRLTEKARIKPI